MQNIYHEVLEKTCESVNSKTTGSLYSVIKRIVDIIFSSIILSITFPLMVFIAVLIKIDSKGPAFYVQNRVGKDGKIIKIIKLRTMYINKNECGGGIKTVDGDPRITRVGKLIRKCSIDEFPQFINILTGDMSYIGPRPISVDEHNVVVQDILRQNKSFPQGLIHRVKPGITGWALLHGREKISYENRFKLNAYYENNMSLWFDLKIFFLTFKKYLFTNFMVFGLFLLVAAIIIHFFIF